VKAGTVVRTYEAPTIRMVCVVVVAAVVAAAVVDVAVGDAVVGVCFVATVVGDVEVETEAETGCCLRDWLAGV